MHAAQCSRADLLRLLCEQEELRHSAYAATLGFTRTQSEQEAKQDKGKEGPTGSEGEAGAAAPAMPQQVKRPIRYWYVEACYSLADEEESTELEATPGSAAGLEKAAMSGRLMPSGPPLFNPGEWQNWSDRHLQGQRCGQVLDMPLLRKRLSRAQPIHRLPRLKRSAFNQGISLLLERSGVLRPAWEDMRLAYKAVGPLLAAADRQSMTLSNGPNGRWQAYGDTPPLQGEADIPAGNAIVCIGTFGALHSGIISSDWQAFLQRRLNAGQRCLLLALCPIENAPCEVYVADPQPQQGERLLRIALALLPMASTDRLRHVRCALNGVGIGAELRVYQHEHVEHDYYRHLFIREEHRQEYFQAYQQLPPRKQQAIQQALAYGRDCLSPAAQNSEALLTDMACDTVRDLSDYTHLQTLAAAVAQQLKGQAGISSEHAWLRGQLPLSRLLAKQGYPASWQTFLNTAQTLALKAHQVLPLQHRGLKSGQAKYLLQQSQNGLYLRENGANQGLPALGDQAYCRQTGKTITPHSRLTHNELDIIDHGRHWRLESMLKPYWAEQIWQERDGLYLSQAEGAVFKLQAADESQSQSHWQCLHKPWPWAVEQGIDDYGLWAAFEVKGVRQRMRWIPPGTFIMGSPEDEPGRRDNEQQHQVRLTKGFWLADTACTQELWEAVMGNNPSGFKGAQRPVERVSWEDCQGFIEQLQHHVPELPLSLPTEAQWEYACRAGTQTPFSTGDNISTDQANYDGNSPYNGAEKGLFRKETSEALGFTPNPWGLYQKHGNVWEWCADWLGDYPAEPVVDPTGPMDGDRRVLRGGGWIGDAQDLRSAFRVAGEPVGRYRNSGLRLAGGFQPPGRPLSAGRWERSG